MKTHMNCWLGWVCSGGKKPQPDNKKKFKIVTYSNVEQEGNPGVASFLRSDDTKITVVAWDDYEEPQAKQNLAFYNYQEISQVVQWTNHAIFLYYSWMN